MSHALQSTLFLLISLVLVLLNGFFVAAEFALVKVRATRIEELVARNEKGATRVQRIQRNLDAYLSATQLGVTLASLGLGSLGEPTLAELLEPHVGHWQSHLLAATLAFTGITFFHIVIGELIPKWAAIQGAERLALLFSLPLDLFYKVFRFPITILYRAAVLVARALRIEPSAEGGEAHSEEELRLILDASHAGGEIDEGEKQLVNRVFDFAHQQAKEIMIPRPDVVFLSTGRPLHENIDRAERSGYTRFPLIEGGSPDDVTGMVHIRDLFNLLRMSAPQVNTTGDGGGGLSPDEEAAALRGLARSLPRVPETKPIDVLLQEFQRQRQHMAIVVDEYGGTAGIVTMEDIFEEIVGDIQDEFDRSMPPELEPAGKDCYSVDARLSLTKLVRVLDIVDFPAEPKIDTVGGWVLASETADTAVHVGTVVSYGSATITVTEMSGRRVRKVRVCIPERPSLEGTGPIGSSESHAASETSVSSGVSR